MKPTNPVPDTVTRCSSCHTEDPVPATAYECSRCSSTFTQDDLEGPPYRCPDDNIFLARSEDEVCSDCSEPLEIETVTVYRCSGCGDVFDAVDTEHDCTDDEKAATAARHREESEARQLDRERRHEQADVDAENTTAALRALGFKVETNYSERPGDHTDGGDYDFWIMSTSTSMSMDIGLFHRLVTLAAAKQEV